MSTISSISSSSAAAVTSPQEVPESKKEEPEEKKDLIDTAIEALIEGRTKKNFPFKTVRIISDEFHIPIDKLKERMEKRGVKLDPEGFTI